MRNSYLNEYIRIFRKAVKKEVWQLRVSDNDLCLAAAPLFGQLWKCGVTDRFLIVWRRQLLAPITVPDGLWFNGVPTQLLGGFGPFSFFCFHFYCFFLFCLFLWEQNRKKRCDSQAGLAGLEGGWRTAVRVGGQWRLQARMSQPAVISTSWTLTFMAF